MPKATTSKATPPKAATPRTARKATTPLRVVRQVDPATGAAMPVLREISPQSLIVGANVRLDPRLDKTFIASIRERGVLEPVVAYTDDDGDLVVLHGQRRTLAAVQADRETIPVVVVPQPADGDRLVDQLVENDHREALTNAERVNAYEQMALVGLSAAQIARKTATSRDQVDAALTVAKNTVARDAAERWENLDLAQAAVIAEFADDESAVKDLVHAAERGHGFDHLAQRLRTRRADDAARAAATARLTDAGVTVIDEPAYNDPHTAKLDRLTHDGVVLTEETHRDCPGHVAYLAEHWDNSPDPDDGDCTDDDPSPEWVPEWACVGYAVYGHTRPGLFGGVYNPGRSGPAAAEPTDAVREQAAAERREVINGNKAWAAAETVRRQWLTTFLARKTAPKTAAMFVAGSLAHGDHALTTAMAAGHPLAHDLFGAERVRDYGRRGQGLTKLLDTASEPRALMIALGVVLAAYEAATGPHSWRPPLHTETTRYLRYLAVLGYELSDIEQRACAVTEQERA